MYYIQTKSSYTTNI